MSIARVARRPRGQPQCPTGARASDLDTPAWLHHTQGSHTFPVVSGDESPLVFLGKLQGTPLPDSSAFGVYPQLSGSIRQEPLTAPPSRTPLWSPSCHRGAVPGAALGAARLPGLTSSSSPLDHLMHSLLRMGRPERGQGHGCLTPGGPSQLLILDWWTPTPMDCWAGVEFQRIPTLKGQGCCFLAWSASAEKPDTL